jgi:cytidylate kinase
MLEAAQWEWERVFGDSSRLIMSIYSEGEEHIGESQIILDGKGGAELSVLIGRRDLWHRGYGTSAALQLMDKVFGPMGASRAWVRVPDDNTAALAMFQKLGFGKGESAEPCRRPDGSTFAASVLSMDVASYRLRQPGDSGSNDSLPVITITGLPGSDSRELAEEIARTLGARFVDDEVEDELCRRLTCSQAELDAFEGSYRSFWSRLLNAIVVPMEWSATYDAGYQGFIPDQFDEYASVLEEPISKQQYVERLSRAVRKFAAEGDVVMHGHACQLFVPTNERAFNVFVSASIEYRQQRIANETGVDSEVAGRLLKRQDRETRATFQNLFGAELTDPEYFDVTVNIDRMSVKVCAELVVGALKIGSPSVVPLAETQIMRALASR